MASRRGRTASARHEQHRHREDALQPVAKDFEALALAARDRLAEQGHLGSSEGGPVDWTTGEGQDRLSWLMRVAGVPEEYRQPTLDRCRVQNEVRRYAADIDDRLERGEGSIIFGPTGTGKSSTAALVVLGAIRARPRLLERLSIGWHYVPDVCDRMLDTYRRQEVRRLQVSVDLLVWDDFGVRPFSEFEIGVLDQIVEARYRMRKPMIITTNLTPEAIRNDQRFARMRDRWRQRNEAWVIEGASQREFGK